MPNPSKQRQAIIELVSLSSTARAIADRLDVSLSASADISELRKKIEVMGERIDELAHAAEENSDAEASFTDEDAHDFNTAFTQSLHGLDAHTITDVYGRAYLRAYPRNIRVLVCTCLLNVFKSRNLEPLSIWQTVVANNGSII